MYIVDNDCCWLFIKIIHSIFIGTSVFSLKVNLSMKKMKLIDNRNWDLILHSDHLEFDDLKNTLFALVQLNPDMPYLQTV